MRAFGAREHLAAILVALLLVLGLRIQDKPLPMLAVWAQAHTAVNYTPYFPGLNRIEQHEVFAPENRPVRKIIFLGASAVHSVGCDSTWIPPSQAIREPANVHHSCSVAAQVNEELARRGVSGWKAFNLAKAGGRLAPMLYVFAKVQPLKPDLVVYGDNFPYFMETNAGADNLLPGDYAALGQVFSASPAAASLWHGFEGTLQRNGLLTGVARSPRNIGKSFMRLQPDDSVSGALANLLSQPRNRNTELEHPQPLRYAAIRSWEQTFQPLKRFDNPDPGFGYFQGVALMDEMQKLHGGRVLFYYSPQYDHRGDAVYEQGLDREFGGYLRSRGVAYTSLVGLPLEPIIDTYDGHHQTVNGNRKIAAALVDQMQAQGLLK